ncbi:hypothetical protein L6452_01633 [Arctium lappa]|uniref:Uncharacterized protein n=1 Tax=Arctium lappa TaxID=4217 RepID=A0ACB9FGN6_ARCLA|nr:hypothetical protein L6452_01633 [Arctium lappa]
MDRVTKKRCEKSMRIGNARILVNVSDTENPISDRTIKIQVINGSLYVALEENGQMKQYESFRGQLEENQSKGDQQYGSHGEIRHNVQQSGIQIGIQKGKRSSATTDLVSSIVKKDKRKGIVSSVKKD